MAEKDTKLTEVRALCGKCGGQRNCHIHGQLSERYDDDYFSWWKEWLLLQCKGCDNIFVQTKESDSESYDFVYDHNGEKVTVHQKRFKYWPAISARKRPSWFADDILHDVKNSSALDESLVELYGALDGGLNMLAGIGIRTTFDVASELLGVKPELTFQAKLTDLVTKGHIGKADEATLADLVDAGSASAHRGWRPSSKDLDTLMDVLEHFIESAFVAPAKKSIRDQKMKALKGNVPARKNAVKASMKKSPKATKGNKGKP